MKQFIKLISLLLLLLIVNGAYFEYCVSRNLPTYLSVIAPCVTFLIDIFSLAKIVKVITRILKLN